ncbi:hypothetical protein K432DRAFT_409613 [Lepidopterella palustris CBS 459.81]|uniref:C2H2-type domain-containing protein n=1 Tax=Lepidopterella palustris CBS 459.81 TaxID=1314670 RepID=A0A8E2JAE9_9PEZI|nr:hypothetical protein K432DRAFT_409613 [Lepidopterella palustris CBS 459.81]
MASRSVKKRKLIDRGGDSESIPKKARPELDDEDSQSEYSQDFLDTDIDDEPTSTPRTPITTSRASSEANRLYCYHCPIENCDRSFNRPCRLAEHIRTHTNERPYVCTHAGCDKAYRRSTHLKHHLTSIHGGERKFVCDWEGCGKNFVTGQRMRAHRKTHDSNERKEQFRCKEYPPCNEVFRKHSTLQAHINVKHLGELPYPCNYVDEATGERCTCGFETAQNLKRHTATVHSGPRYFCNICTAADEAAEAGNDTSSPPTNPVGFQTYPQLQAHIAEAHPPTCEHCGMKCATKATLKAHIEIAHGTPLDARRNFPCPHCDRAFTKKGNLNVHIQAIHNKAKPFVCGEFNVNKSKVVEIIAWTGEGACGHAASTKQGLEEHIRTAHLGLEGMPKLRKKARGIDTAPKPTKKRGANPTTLSNLTGVGYEESGRNIPCLVEGCAYRFTRDYDLEIHLKATHWLPDEEVEVMMAEMVVERKALEGGPFWIGGGETIYEEQYQGLGEPASYQTPYGNDVDMEDQEAESALDREMGIAGLPAFDVRNGLPWPAC